MKMFTSNDSSHAVNYRETEHHLTLFHRSCVVFRFFRVLIIIMVKIVGRLLLLYLFLFGSFLLTEHVDKASDGILYNARRY